MPRHPYTLRRALPEEGPLALELERQVWAPFNWLAEGSVGLDYDPDLHVVAVDDAGKMVATIDACGMQWDGDPKTLPPEGWRDVNLLAAEGFAEQPPYACALGASILTHARGGGLAQDLLSTLRTRVFEMGYEGMLAPVRPSARAQMPHLSIKEYAEVRLPDGRHFDPWMRAHESVGGKIVAVTERSMYWWGEKEGWEEWIGVKLPDNGRLLIEGSTGWLTLIDGYGELVEDSVWFLHAPQKQ